MLDDPRLPAALMRAGQGACASLPLFSYVMVRHALRRLGEEDRRLADYVAAMLMHFGMRDNARRISAADDQVYDSLAALLADVDDPDGRRSFLVRTHLGNYALWLSGLFPDYIEHRRWRRGGPDLDYYEEMGRRGLPARGRTPARGRPRARDAVRHGGGSIRPAARGAERRERLAALPDRYSPERLMRQVTSEARWRRLS